MRNNIFKHIGPDPREIGFQKERKKDAQERRDAIATQNPSLMH